MEPMEGAAYLLLNEHAEPIGISETMEEALSLAHEADSKGRVFLDAPTEQDFVLIEEADAAETALAANAAAKRHLRLVARGRVHEKIASAPQDAITAVAAAMKRPGAITADLFDFEAAKRLTVADAHETLRPFFPRFKYTGSGDKKAVRGYDKPRTMAEYILGQNYKTAKGTPREIIDKLQDLTGFRKANVLGLSLLPTTQSYAEPMVQQILKGAKRNYGVRNLLPTRLNACVRATEQCASSCLVFSGRNLADDYNTVKKYSLLQALIHEPQAFMRMLVEAIRIHRDRSFRSDTMPLVRLNVFSDLPWERMVPELFDEFHDVQFYDYTKVPGRTTPDNYDLTFSFAGTEQNVAAMDYEIRRQQRRVAVVFAAVGLRRTDEGAIEIPTTPRYYRRKSGAERPSPRPARLPKSFLGLEVIDGDLSDMRPYDPAPSIVGLRWKNPANQNVTLEQANVFIVLVDLVQEAGGYYDAIVSKTARFDDVDYSKYAASRTDR